MAANLTTATSRDGGPTQWSHTQPSHPPRYKQTRDTSATSATSPDNKQTRKDVLRDAFFADWKDDASSGDLADPNEMQKQDPLGIQIWKLYSKTKTQLPNRERMDNLSWRMMSMNLKRKEQEQARWVSPFPGSLVSLYESLD